MLGFEIRVNQFVILLRVASRIAPLSSLSEIQLNTYESMLYINI
jgi:hypothetical protein